MPKTAHTPWLAWVVIVVLVLVLLGRLGKKKGDASIDPTTGGVKLAPDAVYGPAAPSAAFSADSSSYTGVGSADYTPPAYGAGVGTF